MGSEHVHDAAYWADRFKVVGGNPALDFINTVSERRGSRPIERLRTYDDLIEASTRIGVLTETEAEAIRDAARAAPAAAEDVRKRAVALREVLYGIFSAVARARAPSSEDLAGFNSAVSEALVHVRVSRVDGAGAAFAWAWEESPAALDRLLWPIVRSAADLLVSNRLDRVLECAADDCGWLFLDLSRNRSRRWCDMRECGNRAKMRRFMERRRR